MIGRRPRITVVMAARNAEATIGAAMASLFGQTLPADEIVVVDDASTDRTAEILRGFAHSSLKLLLNETQAGVARSLNRALAQGSGDLVARMDADDISAPTRFEAQCAFLAAHRDIALVGSWVRTIDIRSRVRGQINLPTEHAAICGYAALSPPFRHPSVIIRRSVLDGLTDVYDPQAEGAEDYDLWARLLPRHRAVNLAEHLLDYRIHPTAVSVERRAFQSVVHARAAWRYAQEMTGRGDLDGDVFQKLADTIVLRSSLAPETLRALCEIFGLINAGVAQRFGAEEGAAQKAAAEQYHVLARLCWRSGPAALAALLGEVARHGDMGLARGMAGPLTRDLRRLHGARLRWSGGRSEIT